MITLDLLIYLVSFVVIWAGTGLIVGSTDKISRKLGIPSFAISFVILGILTSTPELAVGLTSIAEGQPEIFVGNLLGGIIILFLLIIPLLAVAGNGIKLDHGLDNYTVLFCLLVILAPSLLILDKRVTNEEGALLVLLYLILLYFVLRKEGFLDRSNTKLLEIKSYSLIDIFKILGGVALVFISSHIIVDKTISFAEIFRISPFYISLLALSLGTNLPELSIAVRAIALKKKAIAFGDYLGSAAANVLLFGMFTLLNIGEVLTVNGFYVMFAFMFSALTLFYFFSKSKNTLSRGEGLILLGIYAVFVFSEIAKF